MSRQNATRFFPISTILVDSSGEDLNYFSKSSTMSGSIDGARNNGDSIDSHASSSADDSSSLDGVSSKSTLGSEETMDVSDFSTRSAKNLEGSPSTDDTSSLSPDNSMSLPRMPQPTSDSSIASCSTSISDGFGKLASGGRTKSVKRPEISPDSTERLAQPPGKMKKFQCEEFLMDRREHLNACKRHDEAIRDHLMKFDKALEKVNEYCEQLVKLSDAESENEEELRLNCNKLKYQIAVTTTACEKIDTLVYQFEELFNGYVKYLKPANQNMDVKLNALVESFLQMNLEVNLPTW